MSFLTVFGIYTVAGQWVAPSPSVGNWPDFDDSQRNRLVGCK